MFGQIPTQFLDSGTWNGMFIMRMSCGVTSLQGDDNEVQRHPNDTPYDGYGVAGEASYGTVQEKRRRRRSSESQNLVNHKAIC